jgi:hypothetical protein
MAVRYRKTALIHAMQWRGDNFDQIAAWLNNLDATCSVIDMGTGELDIRTLEDGSDGRAKHVASTDDWIAVGQQREVYAIKPDIFADTYEPAE